MGGLDGQVEPNGAHITSFHKGDDTREAIGRLEAQVQYRVEIHTPKLASDEGH
jgi:hypothetical protein